MNIPEKEKMEVLKGSKEGSKEDRKVLKWKGYICTH